MGYTLTPTLGRIWVHAVRAPQWEEKELIIDGLAGDLMLCLRTNLVSDWVPIHNHWTLDTILSPIISDVTYLWLWWIDLGLPVFHAKGSTSELDPGSYPISNFNLNSGENLNSSFPWTIIFSKVFNLSLLWFKTKTLKVKRDLEKSRSSVRAWLPAGGNFPLPRGAFRTCWGAHSFVTLHWLYFLLYFSQKVTWRSIYQLSK